MIYAIQSPYTKRCRSCGREYLLRGDHCAACHRISLADQEAVIWSGQEDPEARPQPMDVAANLYGEATRRSQRAQTPGAEEFTRSGAPLPQGFGACLEELRGLAAAYAR